MDCSIVPVKRHGLSMVSTTDFFYPLVDDPYLMGKIGAANVLSDMYALGIVDIDNVLMILGVSRKMTIPDQEIVASAFIEGFNDLCTEADTQCTGGQTVLNPWPIIGGTAMSMCSEEEMIHPSGAIAGDVLVLTKPLGTQIAVNLHEYLQLEDLKQWSKCEGKLTKKEADEAYLLAVASMLRLNKTAAMLMHRHGAHAATDVTGFGLLGHATNLAENQKASVTFKIDSLPIIKGMEVAASIYPFFKLMMGYSAETSGGLLVALPAEKATLYMQDLMEIDGTESWIIGKVHARSPSSTLPLAFISGSPTVIEVNK
eukprot:TRINITY_DN6131_c0_g1_i1.p1 TRINITY_DN6131_c0_g1~~TRINITY_DN6131_c0_g1_i1.p1  ORF type:complete len:314 (+),score=77.60 TRINITY_DN6131_c0_g1_i1:302-1243(+)